MLFGVLCNLLVWLLYYSILVDCHDNDDSGVIKMMTMKRKSQKKYIPISAVDNVTGAEDAPFSFKKNTFF